MSFKSGFAKTAGEPIAFGAIGGALRKGLQSAGAQTVKDTLHMKGNISNFTNAAKAAGGAKNLYATQKGREHLAEAVGKSAPGLGVAAGATYAAKKVYDKATKGDGGQQGQGYY
jgi:hypothetical protein